MIAGMIALALVATPSISFDRDAIARVTINGADASLPYMMTLNRVCVALEGRQECWLYRSEYHDGALRQLTSLNGVKANIAFK